MKTNVREFCPSSIFLLFRHIFHQLQHPVGISKTKGEIMNPNIARNTSKWKAGKMVAKMKDLSKKHFPFPPCALFWPVLPMSSTVPNNIPEPRGKKPHLSPILLNASTGRPCSSNGLQARHFPKKALSAMPSAIIKM